MRLRDLDTIDDFDAVVRLQRDVWGADYDDIVPRSQFVVAAKTGGILIGAEDERGRLVGCRVLGARPAPRPHRAVVAPARRRAAGARPGARPAAQAGAARAGAGPRHRPDRVDLRSAAGRATRGSTSAASAASSRPISTTSTDRRPARCTAACRPIASSRRGTSAHRTSVAAPRGRRDRGARRQRRPGAARAADARGRTVPRAARRAGPVARRAAAAGRDSGRLRADAGRGDRPGAGLAARRPPRLPHLLRARLSRRRRRR